MLAHGSRAMQRSRSRSPEDNHGRGYPDDVVASADDRSFGVVLLADGQPVTATKFTSCDPTDGRIELHSMVRYPMPLEVEFTLEVLEVEWPIQWPRDFNAGEGAERVWQTTQHMTMNGEWIDVTLVTDGAQLSLSVTMTFPDDL